MAKVSIIVPTYNEKQTIERLVEGVFEALNGASFELIIVDDGSPDGTGELADQLATARPNLRVIHRPAKSGRGTALVEGMKAADGDIFGIMDGDMQHPPDVLRKLLDEAEAGADVAIASRYVGGGGTEDRSAARSIVSKGALWLSHLFLPQTRHVKDTQSGYFLFHRKVVDGVSIDVRGFTALVEVLAKGKYAKTVEVPYTFRRRVAGESKLGGTEVLRYVAQLLRLSEYRVFKFMGVGASGLLVNNAVLWALVTRSGYSPLTASLVAIEASILSNFIFNHLWTFRQRKAIPWPITLAKYHGSVAIGAAVNFATLAVLLGAGAQLLLANTVGIVLGFVSNYILSEKVVWRYKEAPGLGGP